MSKWEIRYGDGESCVVEASSWSEARDQSPHKSKSGASLAHSVTRVPDDSEVSVETEAAGDSGEAGDAEAAAAGGDETAEAEPAEGEPAGDDGESDAQGGGV